VHWFADHAFAVALLLVYTGLLAWHAYVGQRSSKGVADYYVGGRNMSGFVVGASFFATLVSTNSYIGHAGKGYEYGLPWFAMAGLMVVFAWISWRLVAPRLRAFTREWDSVTLPDFLAARFGGRAVRIAGALVIVFASLLYLVAIFKGAGHLFQVFLGVSYAASVCFMLVIVMGYTAMGGFISVVRTDVIQGGMMLLGAVLMFYFVSRAAGGAEVIFTAQETAHLRHLDAGIPLLVLLGIALSGSIKLIVDPRQISRFYALRDARSIRAGIWVAVGGILLVQLCLFPVGMYASVLLEGVTDTDLIVPTLVNDPGVFPRAAGDFLVVAILAAAMSSLDSVLLVAASVFVRDVLAEVRPLVGSRQIRWTRIGVVAWACVGATIALRPPGDIVEITIFSGSLYAVCFTPAILLGLHWRRGDAFAVLASMVVGVCVLVAWLGSNASSWLHEVFPALLASTATYVICAVWRPAHADPRVVAAFTRAGDGYLVQEALRRG
jgi:SSS family transporter